MGKNLNKEFQVCALKRIGLLFAFFLSIIFAGHTANASPLSDLRFLTEGRCGDADLSYFVNIADALIVSRWDAYGGPVMGYIDTIEEATATCYNADSTSDYRTSIIDALNIARYTVGLRLLECNDISLRCAPGIFGGPFGGYPEINFSQCLSLFYNPSAAATFSLNNFETTFCDPNTDCGRGTGESESPCVPVIWSSTQDVLNNVRPGYSFIGSVTATSCRALDQFTEIPVGTCFHGTLGVIPLSGLNPSGRPVSDEDCDGWTDAVESCIDSHIQTPDYFDQSNFTAPVFSCFYDMNPGAGPLRDFIICHD